MPTESIHPTLNAFTQDFLRRLDQAREPNGAHEAGVAGPWVIRTVPYRGTTGFALLREWESAEAGDAPYAIFRRREDALLAAAVLPATGRERLCLLGSEPEAEGFPVQDAPEPSATPGAEAVEMPTGAPGGASGDGAPRRVPAGHLRDFDEDLAAALHVVEAIVRSPVSLARLLEAAGFVALEQAGRILASTF
jgi:hypothetical protein